MHRPLYEFGWCASATMTRSLVALQVVMLLVSRVPGAAAVDAVGQKGCSAEACVLNSGSFKFGTGDTNSIDEFGLLTQPSYYSISAGTWYALTYRAYPFDAAIGTGTGGSHWSGNTVDDLRTLTPTASTYDYAGFLVTSINGTVSTGYGTVVTSAQFTTTDAQFVLQHTITLNQTDNFITVVSNVTNVGTNPMVNTHLWLGTKDDFVGTYDQCLKTRGNLVAGAFTAVTNVGGECRGSCRERLADPGARCACSCL